jgi:hypothetical protein
MLAHALHEGGRHVDADRRDLIGRSLVIGQIVGELRDGVAWRSGVLAFWRSGVLAFWRSGVLAFWRSGVTNTTRRACMSATSVR